MTCNSVQNHVLAKFLFLTNTRMWLEITIQKVLKFFKSEILDLFVLVKNQETDYSDYINS